MNPKTDLPCDCGAITIMMGEPDSLISICPHRGLFMLNDSWVVYFCFSCGGKLPDSSKPIYVPILTAEEQTRLEQLAQSINSREEAIARLGTPDYDGDVQADSVRNVEFYGLSKTGNIEFYFSESGQARFIIAQKWLPPRHLEDGETI